MKKQKDRKKKRITPAPSPSAEATLSLCLIVKNEAGRLAECLDPLRPLVDEIIVVDTGSTDRTRELARERGAKVFEFPWIDDFSAARNESLRQAAGRYILWLDADDRLDPEEIDKLRSLKAGLPLTRPQAYNLLVQSYSPLDGESSFYQLRLFPNKPGVRFEGRVHEQVNFSLQRLGIPIENQAICIRHTGYENLAAIKGKYERNWAILEAELKQDPHNLVLCYYAARTLSGMDRYAEAVAYLQQITGNRLIQRKEKTFYLQAAILLGKYYLTIQKFPEAQALFRQLAEDYPDNPIVHYGRGESHYLAGDFERACPPLRRALELPLEVTVFPVNVERFIYDQFNTLGNCYQKLGRKQEAEGVWKAYLDRYPGHFQTWELLGSLALEDNRLSAAADYLQEAVNRGSVSDRVLANLGLCYRKLKKRTEAEQALRRALEINPERLEALINLGLLFYEQREHLRALEYLHKALALDPGLIDIRLFISDILAREGEVEGLVAVCDELLQILDLERNITLNSLRELGELFFRIAGALDQGGKPSLAMIALQVGFTLAPTREALEQLIAKAKKFGKLEETLQRLEQDLDRLRYPLPPAAESA